MKCTSQTFADVSGTCPRNTEHACHARACRLGPPMKLQHVLSKGATSTTVNDLGCGGGGAIAVR
jgi:hypothetical protein